MWGDIGRPGNFFVDLVPAEVNEFATAERMVIGCGDEEEFRNPIRPVFLAAAVKSFTSVGVKSSREASAKMFFLS